MDPEKYVFYNGEATNDLTIVGNRLHRPVGAGLLQETNFFK